VKPCILNKYRVFRSCFFLGKTLSYPGKFRSIGVQNGMRRITVHINPFSRKLENPLLMTADLPLPATLSATLNALPTNFVMFISDMPHPKKTPAKPRRILRFHNTKTP
jgi:hypothetical protein